MAHGELIAALREAGGGTVQHKRGCIGELVTFPDGFLVGVRSIRGHDELPVEVQILEGLPDGLYGFWRNDYGLWDLDTVLWLKDLTVALDFGKRRGQQCIWDCAYRREIYCDL